MWCSGLCFLYVALACGISSAAEDEPATENSDETSQHIFVEVKGVLKRGESATTITANNITWELELPRYKKVYTDPKFLEKAKSLDGRMAIIKGALRRETSGGFLKKQRWIVHVWELKAVPKTLALTLTADDQGDLAAIYLADKKYDQPSDVEKALRQYKQIDRVVLLCDPRLKYQHVVSTMTMVQKKTLNISIRKRPPRSARSEKEEDPER